MRNDPLRIGLVAWNFPLLSEPFVTTLAMDLVEAGQDLRVLTFDNGDTGEGLGEMHPGVHASDLLSRTGRAGAAPPPGSAPPEGLPAAGPGRWLERGRRLAAGLLPARRLGRARLALREGRFDVVHCQFANLGLAAAGLRRAGLLQTRALVVHIRGYDITEYVDRHGAQVYRGLFSCAELMVANCRHFADRAVALGCPPEKITVIGSPIDTALFSPPASRDPPGGRPVRLIAVGRLVEKKGFADAIAAVGILRGQGRDVVLEIYGEGPDRASLERQISDGGLGDAVILHGAATQARLVAALHRADIGLAPSVRSASGNEDAPVNTLKEAMATGLPVIATRHGGIPELVIPGENGALVPERSPRELAAAIADLADRPDEWRAMGEAGRALVVARFDRRLVRDRTLAAYRAALGEQGPPATLGPPGRASGRASGQHFAGADGPRP